MSAKERRLLAMRDHQYALTAEQVILLTPGLPTARILEALQHARVALSLYRVAASSLHPFDRDAGQPVIQKLVQNLELADPANAK